MNDIAENIAVVRHRVAEAASKAGRNASDINLIAVSKTHDHHAVLAAMMTGQTVFGENRVQEAKAKIAAIRSAGLDEAGAGNPNLDNSETGQGPKIQMPLSQAEWHLIGPLQTNKAEEAVKLFDVIHTLDRPKLATALAQAMDKAGRRPRLYIEVNIGHEPQKAGIAPDQLGEFLEFCAGLKLGIDGLMCIPPQGDDPSGYFQPMKALAQTHGLARLSMGMSGDYEAAIACGATDVRVGTAIFGSRLPRTG